MEEAPYAEEGLIVANHKRKRTPSTRAGCKMCKPYKDQRFSKRLAQREIAGTGGFGKLRKLRATEDDMRLYR